MEHLKTDEIIEFVSAKKLTDESVELAKKINGHIRDCDRCLKVVRSFQMIFDEFEKMGSGGCFKKFLNEKLIGQSNTGDLKVKNATEEIDGYR